MKMSIQQEKKLRQDIHALRIKKFNWDKEVLHQVMKSLGFGDSVTMLSGDELLELKYLLIDNPKDYLPIDKTLDKQGRFMYSLMKQADLTMDYLTAYLLKKYHKPHWNLLKSEEKKAVISMLQYYKEKNYQNQTNQ